MSLGKLSEPPICILVNVACSQPVSRIEITNIDFRGGVVANILNLIESRLRNTIENKVDEFLCDYMSDLEDVALGFLGTVSDFVIPYLEPVDSFDPLAPELALNGTLNPEVNLIDFKAPEGVIGVSVDAVLNEASRILGSERDDPDEPTGKGRDMAVNILI